MDKPELKVAIFAIVNEHYRNDFDLFWQRTQFFLLLQAGMLGFYFSRLISPAAPRWARLTLVGAGLLLCLVWWLVAQSSIHWISIWRREVVRIDDEINPYRSFTRGEAMDAPVQTRYMRLRPEVISSMMPLGFGIVWIVVAWMRLKAA
jgi:hypothetical protein